MKLSLESRKEILCCVRTLVGYITCTWLVHDPQHRQNMQSGSTGLPKRRIEFVEAFRHPISQPLLIPLARKESSARNRASPRISSRPFRL